ncbi:DUF3696 domain-containing protein [Corallococcus interemptor]|uniref:AAA family ATPase n=1 Tax=Corallococcus interemptor TaxID=2316720 RepID=UPI003D0286BD
MITKWSVANFKSIGEPTSLPLAPLTVFCGTNSSGKSTIIQSILLISQTLSSKVGSRSVVLNGSLTKLGQYDDLKTTGSKTENIEISWECRPVNNKDQSSAGPRPSLLPSRSPTGILSSERVGAINCSLSFSAGGTGAEHDLQQLQPQLLTFSLSHIDPETSDIQSRISISRLAKDSLLKAKLDEFSISEPESESLKSSLLYNVQLDTDSAEEITDEFPSAVPIGCILRHFIPIRLTVRLDETREISNYIFSELAENRAARNRVGRLPVDTSLSSEILEVIRKHLSDELAQIMLAQESIPGLMQYTLQDWRTRRRKLSQRQRLDLNKQMLAIEVDLFTAIKREGKQPHLVEPQRMPRELLSCAHYLDTYFSSSLKYLGPLRDEPKALYPIATATDPSDVGIRGENTAAVYDLHRKRKISYLPSSKFTSPEVNVDPHRSTLSEAVLDWLSYLGVASDINTKDRGKLGHELRVTTTDNTTAHDLTHVGVGVSQVLPILVACLLADDDTVLIIEQPELHLHPRVQTLLADFFLSMALLGKQCILETHSEYLINRLRYRIAAADRDTLSSSTTIYFAEKENGLSKYRPVPINEYGAIINWPAGFFDESQKESETLLRIAMEKRRKAQRK